MGFNRVIVSVASFIKFRGQISRNVYDVRKVFHEMTLCVSACFFEFYVLVLKEIVMRAPKLVYNHTRMVNNQGRQTKGPTKSF